MNIFVLDNDPQTAAQSHCDSHVRKMILESRQILSTVVWKTWKDDPPKPHLLAMPSHERHPCTLWAGYSLENWMWLEKLYQSLLDEFSFRFNKDHDHEMYRNLPTPHLPFHSRSPFVTAMPEECVCTDPVESYRRYYLNHKLHLLSYTRRLPPSWLPSWAIRSQS